MLPSEIYIGSVDVDWKFSVADYTADCVKSIPFNLFDKAVCSLLNIEGQMTAVQMGKILGLNVIDAPDEGEYFDNAEFELLTEALEEMVDFGMIITSRFDTSFYRLTDLGRKFLENRRKIRTEQNVNFDLYFDWTRNVHTGIRTDLSYLSEAVQVSDDIMPQMRDEQFLRTFMFDQQPTIYNGEDGNDFSNLKIRGASNYVYPVSVALLYNSTTKGYRIIAIDSKNAKNKYFNKSIEGDENLKIFYLKQIIVEDTNKARIITETPEQRELVGAMEKLSSSIDGLTASESRNTINIFNKERSVFEEEYFWDNIKKLIGFEKKKVYLFIEFLTPSIFDVFADLSDACKNTFFYVSFGDSDTNLPDFQGNVFFTHSRQLDNNIVCLCDDGTVYRITPFLHGLDSENRQTNMVVKADDNSIDIRLVEGEFAKIHADNVLRFVSDELSNYKFNPVYEDIARLEWFINLINQFGSWIQKMGFAVRAANILDRINKVKGKLEQDHEKKLLFDINDFTATFDVSTIRRLDKLDELRIKFDEYRRETFDSYSTVNSLLDAYDEELDKREEYIKDTIIAKYFVFDTNVFIDDPRILRNVSYADYVVLAARVVEELNKHKTNRDHSIATNAQTAIRLIGDLRKKDNGHLILDRADLSILPPEFSKCDADNMILAVAMKHSKDNMFLVTSDEGLLQKAAVVKVPGLSLNEFYKFIEKRAEEKKKYIGEARRKKRSASDERRKRK